MSVSFSLQGGQKQHPRHGVSLEEDSPATHVCRLFHPVSRLPSVQVHEGLHIVSSKWLSRREDSEVMWPQSSVHIVFLIQDIMFDNKWMSTKDDRVLNVNPNIKFRAEPPRCSRPRCGVRIKHLCGSKENRYFANDFELDHVKIITLVEVRFKHSLSRGGHLSLNRF